MKSNFRTFVLATLVAAALAACPHRASAAFDSYLTFNHVSGESSSSSASTHASSSTWSIFLSILGF
jgi:hypothetical protein